MAEVEVLAIGFVAGVVAFTLGFAVVFAVDWLINRRPPRTSKWT